MSRGLPAFSGRVDISCQHREAHVQVSESSRFFSWICIKLKVNTNEEKCFFLWSTEPFIGIIWGGRSAVVREFVSQTFDIILLEQIEAQPLVIKSLKLMDITEMVVPYLLSSKWRKLVTVSEGCGFPEHRKSLLKCYSCLCNPELWRVRALK